MNCPESGHTARAAVVILHIRSPMRGFKNSGFL